MEWFRFYSKTLNSPKVQSLPASLFKGWVNLLCLASEADNRGTLPDIDGIAFSLRIRKDEAKRLVDALIVRNFVEMVELGELKIHDWRVFQRTSDSSAERTSRFRNRKKAEGQAQNDTNVTSHETSHETSQQREGDALEQNRAEQNRESGISACADPPKDSDKTDKTEKPKRTKTAKPRRTMPDECPSYTGTYHDITLQHRAGTSIEAGRVEWKRWHAHHLAKGTLIASFKGSWATWVMSKWWQGTEPGPNRSRWVNAEGMPIDGNERDAGPIIWPGGERNG